MEKTLQCRYNAMDVTSVAAFEQIRGGVCQDGKDVYFVRLLGDNGTLWHDVERMDARLSAEMAEGKCMYHRICKLPGLAALDKAEYYAGCYEKWKQSSQESLQTKTSIQKGVPQALLASACQKAVQILVQSKKTFTESMEKNFVVKVLFWLDQVLERCSQNWRKELSFKIVSHNVNRNQEYCFFYFLTLLGMDVLLLQSAQDIGPELEQVEISRAFCLGEWAELEFPTYECERYSALAKDVQKTAGRQEMIKIILPQRNRSKGDRFKQPKSSQIERREKTFEELALLASSVVMVGIHDHHGEVIGTGSGIMIGHKGYILTNNHVASGGCFYTIRIEEDENVYETEEVIKYNQVLDLAVLRIHRDLTPLPVYSGKQRLVRGQRVVAIGSPLGLFNSVSDGIISGFRVIDDVDMIQFTAPISRGSSGGALLNMYGEVIGISTAGMDRGQNINLAVGYEGIKLFVQGFTG